MCDRNTRETSGVQSIKIDGDKVGTFDGYITIFSGSGACAKIKRFIITADGTDNDKFISLNDCLKIIGEHYCIVYVIFDNWMNGKMYCYGNHGDYWTEYGSTVGFC